MIPLGRQLQRLALVAVRPTASSHVVTRVDAAGDVWKVPLAGKRMTQVHKAQRSRRRSRKESSDRRRPRIKDSAA